MALSNAATPRLIGGMVHRSGLMVALALILVGVAVWGLTRVPTAFLPTEDQGYLIVAAQLPDGASKERTDRVLQQIQGMASKVPGVEHVVTVSGVSILDNLASLANAGVAFVVLKDWDARLEERARASARSSSASTAGCRACRKLSPSRCPHQPIQGIGNVGGFTMQVELRNGNFDYALLQTLTNAVVANSNAQSSLQRVATTFRAGAPQNLAQCKPHQGGDAWHHRWTVVRRPLQGCTSRTMSAKLPSSATSSKSMRKRRPSIAPTWTTFAISRSRRATEP